MNGKQLAMIITKIALVNQLASDWQMINNIRN